MDFSYENWIDKNTSQSIDKSVRGRVKSVDSHNQYANVTLLDDETESEIKLLNKTGEILKTGDYVYVNYKGIFSSKNAYISRRNGKPRFTAYFNVLTQSEYDLLVEQGKVIDDIMYVIIGE